MRHKKYKIGYNVHNKIVICGNVPGVKTSKKNSSVSAFPCTYFPGKIIQIIASQYLHFSTCLVLVTEENSSKKSSINRKEKRRS